MDEAKFRALGFNCQPSKPPICRLCGEKLISGVNWYKSCEDHKSKICKVCQCGEADKWWKANIEKGRLLDYTYNRTVICRYNKSRHNARIKKVIWSISKQQYAELIAKPCSYCGHELSEAGIGLDQVKAGQGYTIDNVVPCCKECNIAKSYYFTYEEMILLGKIVKEIKDKRKLNNSQENT